MYGYFIIHLQGLKAGTIFVLEFSDFYDIINFILKKVVSKIFKSTYIQKSLVYVLIFLIFPVFFYGNVKVQGHREPLPGLTMEETRLYGEKIQELIRVNNFTIYDDEYNHIIQLAEREEAEAESYKNYLDTTNFPSVYYMEIWEDLYRESTEKAEQLRISAYSLIANKYRSLLFLASNGFNLRTKSFFFY